jgi:hypothetical protein
LLTLLLEVTQRIILSEQMLTPLLEVTQRIILSEQMLTPLLEVTQRIILSEQMLTPLLEVTQRIILSERMAAPRVGSLYEDAAATASPRTHNPILAAGPPNEKRPTDGTRAGFRKIHHIE